MFVAVLFVVPLVWFVCLVCFLSLCVCVRARFAVLFLSQIRSRMQSHCNGTEDVSRSLLRKKRKRRLCASCTCSMCLRCVRVCGDYCCGVCWVRVSLFVCLFVCTKNTVASTHMSFSLCAFWFADNTSCRAKEHLQGFKAHLSNIVDNVLGVARDEDVTTAKQRAQRNFDAYQQQGALCFGVGVGCFVCSCSCHWWFSFRSLHSDSAHFCFPFLN